MDQEPDDEFMGMVYRYKHYLVIKDERNNNLFALSQMSPAQYLGKVTDDMELVPLGRFLLDP